VIIDDFDIISVALGPSEADTPLIINSNAHLPCPIPFRSLKIDLFQRAEGAGFVNRQPSQLPLYRCPERGLQ
jgi:hypothetical protein